MEQRDGLQKFILACYHSYELAGDPSLARGEYYCSYHAPKFYGTQCVYYPRSVLNEVAAAVHLEGIEKTGKPGDFIVRDYAHWINALYGTKRSLAQHVGRVSTGLGNFHASASFYQPFPDTGL